MCLNISKTATESIKKKLNEEGSIKVYKLYGLNSFNPSRLLYLFRYGSPEFDSIGFTVSSRSSAELTSEEKDAGIVNKGIHVYLTENMAYNSLSWYSSFMVEGIGYAEDFVAASIYDAVFHKIKIEPDVLETAVAKVRNKLRLCFVPWARK